MMVNHKSSCAKVNFDEEATAAPDVEGQSFYQRHEERILSWTSLIIFLLLWELIPAGPSLLLDLVSTHLTGTTKRLVNRT